MIKHFDSLVFSKILKENDYFFKNPVFGRSNTDQSYYEPSASFASNQSKIGASSMTHFHNSAESDISTIRENCSFLPQNLTSEELQAMIVNQKDVVQDALNSVKTQVDEIKEEINLRNQIVQKSSESD